MCEEAPVRRFARAATLAFWVGAMPILCGCSAWRDQQRASPAANQPAWQSLPSPPTSPSIDGRGRDNASPPLVDHSPPVVTDTGRPPLPEVDPSTVDEEGPDYPPLGEDPFRGAPLAPRERDPFPFPRLVNLIVEDEWDLEETPANARAEVLRRRAQADIRRPGPDTANFPNAAYTLPKGRAYLETSPVGFYGPTSQTAPQYNWEFLLRYGVTDNLEFRLFSSGLTAVKGRRGTTGFSPPAFDLKLNLWEENRDYFLPAFGLEVYLETDLGSSRLSSGTQPSINLLFDQTLPGDIQLEYNFSVSGVEIVPQLSDYVFGAQWSLQRHVTEDVALFTHGLYNAAALPRLNLVGDIPVSDVPTAVVVGGGGIWTVNERLSVFGSYNAGLTRGSPTTIALLGFALAF